MFFSDDDQGTQEGPETDKQLGKRTRPMDNYEWVPTCRATIQRVLEQTRIRPGMISGFSGVPATDWLESLRDIGFCFPFVNPQGVLTLGILRDGDALDIQTNIETGPASHPGDKLTVMVVPRPAETYWLLSAPRREAGLYCGFLEAGRASDPSGELGGRIISPLLNPSTSISWEWGQGIKATFIKHIWLEAARGTDIGHDLFSGPMALISTRIPRTDRDVLCITPMSSLAAPSLRIYQGSSRTPDGYRIQLSLAARIRARPNRRPPSSVELIGYTTTGHEEVTFRPEWAA